MAKNVRLRVSLRQEAAVRAMDKWADVEEHLKNGTEKLVIVCFTTTWFPPAVHTTNCLNKIKPQVPFARIFLLDFDQEREAAWSQGVNTVPMTMFYWEKEVFTIRRPDWEDQQFLIGSLPNWEAWLELVRFAKQSGEQGKDLLFADV